MLSLREIKALVFKLAEKINAPEEFLPTFGDYMEDARPFVKIDSLYNWIVMERGTEIESKSTDNLDEIMYKIFESVTSEMASRYAAQNDDEKMDFRRIYFSRHIYLLGVINVNWADKAKKKRDSILLSNPFVDKKL